MLLAFHAGFDLELHASGDLDVDEHHTVEDVLAAFGDGLAQALGTRDGVAATGRRPSRWTRRSPTQPSTSSGVRTPRST